MFFFQEIKIPKRRFSKCSKKTLFLFSLHKWGKMTEPSILIESQQNLQVRNLLGFKINIELNLIRIAVTRNVLKSVKMCRRGSRNNRIETAKAPKRNLVAHRRQEKWKRTSKIQTEYLWCDDVIILSLADSGLRVHGEETPTEAESELTSSLSSAAENTQVNQTGESALLDHILPSTPPTPPTTPRELTSAAVEESAETGDEEIFILLWCVDFFLSQIIDDAKSIKRTGVWSKQGLRVAPPSRPIELKIRLSIWESYNEAKPKIVPNICIFNYFKSFSCLSMTLPSGGGTHVQQSAELS